MLGQGRGIGDDLLPQHLHHVIGGEGHRAGEHLVEDDAHGVQVAAVIDGTADRLLGAHVARGAEDHAGPGELGRGLLALLVTLSLDLGDAEVDELEQLVALVVGRDEHVLRLEVAVHDAVSVRVLEAMDDLQRQLHGALGPERTHEKIGQLVAGEQRHHHVLEAVVGRAVVGGAQAVGVLESGEALGLAIEAGGDVPMGGELGSQDLEGQIATEAQVVHPVDRAHPPLTDEMVDAVLAVDDDAQQSLGIVFGLLGRIHEGGSELDSPWRAAFQPSMR